MRLKESQTKSVEPRAKTKAVLEGLKQGREAAALVRRKAAEAKRLGVPLHTLIPVR